LKKIIIFGFLGIFISCNIQKEIDPKGLDDLPKEFYQRWKLDYGTLNGEKVSGYPPSPEQDYLFKSDGTYVLYSVMNDNMRGVWEYDKIDKRVYVKFNDGEINAIIKDITESSFTLIPPKSSIEGTPLTSLTFYYVPIDD